jgi:lipoprotein-releasing system ATP-binding protein
MTAILEAQALRKVYRGGDGNPIEVLAGIDLTVDRGEFVAIVGASGSGKSTLLHLLGALDAPSGGTVRLAGRSYDEETEEGLAAVRNRQLGFVFQFHHLLPEFNALENAEMPMRIAGAAAADRKGRAIGLLERVGLADRVEHRPGMLSGGEQQRVALARALVMHPSLLLADEPTGNLDEHTAETLHELLREMHREHNLTSIIATHNPRLAAACDRVLRLERGQLHSE